MEHGVHDSLPGPRGGGAWGRGARSSGGHELVAAGKRREMGGRRWAVPSQDCQGLRVGRVEQVGGVGKQSTHTHWAHVCARALASLCAVVAPPGVAGPGTWDLWRDVWLKKFGVGELEKYGGWDSMALSLWLQKRWWGLWPLTKWWPPRGSMSSAKCSLRATTSAGGSVARRRWSPRRSGPTTELAPTGSSSSWTWARTRPSWRPATPRCTWEARRPGKRSAARRRPPTCATASTAAGSMLRRIRQLSSASVEAW